jgi:prepilin-type N-terminal cleavage/methylation domain-containing protein
MHIDQHLKKNRLGRKVGRRAGFSLVELLVVISIALILATLAAPALVSLATSGNFKGNATSVGNLMEEAYSAALSKNTYVWIGFSQLPTNGGGVGVGIVYSPHEDPNDFPNNVSVLTKPVFFPNLNLTTVNPAQYSNIATTSVGQIASVTSANQQVFPVSIGGSNPKSTVLQISPSGQVSIVSLSKFAWVDIGLAPLNGNGKNSAALQMNAFTGRVSMYQP